MINEAAWTLADGVASAADIDKAMKLGANHPIGPLALADMIGIDVCLAIMENLQAKLPGGKKYESLLPCASLLPPTNSVARPVKASSNIKRFAA